MQELRPDCIVHAAAWSAIADCEKNPVVARRINTDATLEMAEAAARLDARFIFFSTDQVFDGKGAPYSATSPVGPLHTSMWDCPMSMAHPAAPGFGTSALRAPAASEVSRGD